MQDLDEVLQGFVCVILQADLYNDGVCLLEGECPCFTHPIGSAPKVEVVEDDTGLLIVFTNDRMEEVTLRASELFVVESDYLGNLLMSVTIAANPNDIGLFTLNRDLNYMDDPA